MQRIFSSIIAATGRQLKQSVNVFQSFMLYRRLPAVAAVAVVGKAENVLFITEPGISNFEHLSALGDRRKRGKTGRGKEASEREMSVRGLREAERKGDRARERRV